MKTKIWNHETHARRKTLNRMDRIFRIKPGGKASFIPFLYPAHPVHPV
jgi:hypothetical protein